MKKKEQENTGVDPEILERLRESGTPEGRERQKREIAEAEQLLGRIIIEWNSIESLLRLNIDAMAHGGISLLPTKSSGLAAAKMEDLLKKMCKDYPNKIHATAAAHVLRWFTILKSYRNHYVHSINHVLHQMAPGKSTEILFMASSYHFDKSKGMMMLCREVISMDHLRSFSTEAARFRGFAMAVVGQVMTHHGANGEIMPKPSIDPLPKLPKDLKIEYQKPSLDLFRSGPSVRRDDVL